MDEQVRDEVRADATPEDHDPPGESQVNIPLIVLVVSSVAFLAYIAFGAVEARIWRFGRLNFEDRTIRRVWSYLGDRLPELPGQSLIAGLYWLGLAVMVIGTVAGLWLFLGTPDEDPSRDVDAHHTGHTSSHA